MSRKPKTVAFFGASTGVGLAALKHTLAAGGQCMALCRTPSKLTAIFPGSTTPNLKIVPGNAHDVAAVSACLQDEQGQLVDSVVSTIGGQLVLSKMKIDDADVCRKGATVLLEALDALRRNGASGRPHIIVCSSTGISRFGRDVPLAMVPLYYVALKVPHRDKVAMEARVVASQEAYTIVRASFMTNGASSRHIRVGIEDPTTGRQSNAIGYTISREDVGRWIAENLVLTRDPKYVNKIATVTY